MRHTTMKARARAADGQQAALAVEVQRMPRCSSCGEKTPRHAEYKRGGQVVRVPLCGKCARKEG